MYSYFSQMLMLPEEKAQLEEMFLNLDKNQDGRISKEELIAAYKVEGGATFNLDIVESIVKQCDINGDGFLSLNGPFIFP